ncbi:hypothetical protein GCM10022251_78650 [Phytohabitans flavus]|uniref:DUF624 domain-containing protein n=1 Tax=Phytohabitans flavus TaxID=1076124 RepID=A0A6F8XY54_9ACTN|nr:DUF624 domain-containing protein [Phytohabitans flavus]BCB78740.1 hypothetical protein Pflav_051500 [Phytohabitans flavus]
MRRFVLFGECLLAGLLTALLALPLVTLLPALAAGCAHIRAHVEGETTAVRAYFARFRAAFPGSVKLSLGVAAAFAVVTVDGLLLRAAVPGGAYVAAFCGIAATALSVVLLRAAATWSPGRSWSDLVRQATVRAATGDPSGSLLLVLALALLVLITWQLLPLAVPTLGCVLMAAVAVERRALVLADR